MSYQKSKRFAKKELFASGVSFTLIRSSRKTIAIEVNKELKILVRAPFSIMDSEARSVVEKNIEWIKIATVKVKKRVESQPKEPTEAEKRRLFSIASQKIPLKVQKYSALMGVMPSGIKITSAKKRFGSCNAKNSLCFSYRLMLYPDEAIDYVVVHELAHIKHKNHSDKFYSEISKILPDYKSRIKLLKNYKTSPVN